LTKIIWYKDFGAKFTKHLWQGTGSKSTGLVSPNLQNLCGKAQVQSRRADALVRGTRSMIVLDRSQEKIVSSGGSARACGAQWLPVCY